jgi:nucleoid-associated protein YgaU
MNDLKRQKQKISFDMAPGDPVQSGLIPPQARRVQIALPTQPKIPAQDFYEEPLFDRAAWERDLALPKPSEPAASTHSINVTPRAPSFAATGLMAMQERGFSHRFARVPRGVGAVAAAFILVVVTGTVMSQRDNPSPQQAAVSSEYMPETFSEVPTRAVIADMTDVSEISAPATPTAQSRAALNTAVPAGLQLPSAVPPASAKSQPERVRDAMQTLGGNKLRMLRESVIAGLFDVEIYTREGVERVRLRTYNAPLANVVSSNLLIDVVGMGDAEMSAALRTPEGGADVETMMFELVQASLLADEDTARVEAALDMSRKIFAASQARTEAIDGRRVYTVQRGDSLAYIALQFYGRPSAYPRILAANRDILQSSGEIQIGQRLTIPS